MNSWLRTGIGEHLTTFDLLQKFPKVITHDKRLSSFDEDQLNYFFHSISELKEKLLALLIQLPPSIDIIEGLDALRNILPFLDKGYRYAVEVRHKSWFQDLAYKKNKRAQIQEIVDASMLSEQEKEWMEEYKLQSLSHLTDDNENRSMEHITMPNLFDMRRNYPK